MHTREGASPSLSKMSACFSPTRRARGVRCDGHAGGFADACRRAEDLLAERIDRVAVGHLDDTGPDGRPFDAPFDLAREEVHQLLDRACRHGP